MHPRYQARISTGLFSGGPPRAPVITYMPDPFTISDARDTTAAPARNNDDDGDEDDEDKEDEPTADAAKVALHMGFFAFLISVGMGVVDRIDDEGNDDTRGRSLKLVAPRGICSPPPRSQKRARASRAVDVRLQRVRRDSRVHGTTREREKKKKKKSVRGSRPSRSAKRSIVRCRKWKPPGASHLH